jgi:hypothetical protein
MRIYTEVNYLWSEEQGKLIQTSSKSYDYEGEVAQCWVMTTIAAVTAVMGMYASWQSAEAAKKSGYATGAEYDLLARKSLLNAKFNIDRDQRKIFEVSASIAEAGADKKALLKREGIFTEGSTTATIGASGVSLAGGTAAQQVIKARLDSASSIMQNLEEIQLAQRNLRDTGEAKMETEWMMAKQQSDKYKRMADMARAGGDVAQFAGMMGGFTKGVSTFNSLGGFKGADSWFDSKPKSPTQESGGTV